MVQHYHMAVSVQNFKSAAVGTLHALPLLYYIYTTSILLENYRYYCLQQHACTGYCSAYHCEC
jgi:hypothetical protein